MYIIFIIILIMIYIILYNNSIEFYTVLYIEYFFSAVSVVSSNTCVIPSPRTKIFFVLLLACTEELISAPKINTF